MNKLEDPNDYPIPMQMDIKKKNNNIKNGRKLCSKCNGTGNEFFYHYRKCNDCNGKGYKKIGKKDIK